MLTLDFFLETQFHSNNFRNKLKVVCDYYHCENIEWMTNKLFFILRRNLVLLKMYSSVCLIYIWRSNKSQLKVDTAISFPSHCRFQETSVKPFFLMYWGICLYFFWADSIISLIHSFSFHSVFRVFKNKQS